MWYTCITCVDLWCVIHVLHKKGKCVPHIQQGWPCLDTINLAHVCNTWYKCDKCVQFLAEIHVWENMCKWNMCYTYMIHVTHMWYICGSHMCITHVTHCDVTHMFMTHMCHTFGKVGHGVVMKGTLYPRHVYYKISEHTCSKYVALMLHMWNMCIFVQTCNSNHNYMCNMFLTCVNCFFLIII